jgi:hypothetical protein
MILARPRSTRRPELECLEDRLVPTTLYGLTDNNFILQFDSASPSTITNVAFISGLQAGERIVGMDFRPRTGQLYGVGIVDGATDTVRVYTLNPLSGAATLIPGSTPFTVSDGNSYGVDFNPTVDRIRVFNDGDENFRINPNSGARADAPTNDTDINPAGNQVEGAAYDRNFDTGTAVANRTTLYAISVTNSSLVTIGGINQSPSPNGGAVQNSQPLGVTLSAAGEVGFDIPAGSSTGFATLRNNATGLTGLYSINLGTGAATLIGSVGNGFTKFAGLAAAPASVLVTGSGAGSVAHVRVFDGLTGAVRFDFLPYGGFRGGVRVASGDVNLDGVPDIIVAPGPGAALPVRVFNGANGAQLPGAIGSFFPFGPGFKGGFQVAAGDVNADGFKDVIVGNDAGIAARLLVFSGANGSNLLNTLPFGPAFRRGLRLAAADFDRDGDTEIVTASGPGIRARVRVLDSAGNSFTSPSLPNFANAFFPYGTSAFGLSVAAGDVNGDGVPDIITGAGPGAPGGHVKVFSGVNGGLLAHFFAFESSFNGGVQVALSDRNRDGRYDIRVTPGAGRAGQVRTFNGLSAALLDAFFAYGGGFKGGIFVGGARF